MNKKAAIELSTNFIVGLIMGIILFSFGIGFAFKIVSTSQGIIEGDLPSYFDSLAKQCVQRGDKVCIPEKNKEIRIGKSDLFGVVINNILKEKANFQTVVSFSRGETEKGVAVTSIDMSKWTVPEYRLLDIKNNNHEVLSLPFQVPGGTKSGSYVFNVKVCYDISDTVSKTCSGEEFYNPTLQVTVTVP